MSLKIGVEKALRQNIAGYANLKYVILSLLISTFFIPNLQASHLVGGDLTYRCLGKTPQGLNRYQVSLILYRDCSGTVGGPPNAPFGEETFMGIFDGRTKNFIRVVTLPIADSIFLIPTITDPCTPPPSEVCYLRGSFFQTIDLPDNPNGYQLVWSACCRNRTIANIVLPDVSGMSFDTRIPDTRLCNNAPTFNDNIPTFICVNGKFEFDMSATDTDGDSLVYELTVPYSGFPPNSPVTLPLPPVRWANGYGLTNIMNGDPRLTVDRKTGKLQVRPRQLGQYVFSVSIFEYRNGVLLTEIKRDLQVNVTPCPINFPPEITIPEQENFSNDTLYVRVGEENCFDFEVFDLNGPGVGIDTLSVRGIGDIFGSPSVPPPYAVLSPKTGVSPLTTTLCWTPSCVFPQVGRQFVLEVIDQNDCPGPNTILDTIYIEFLPATSTPPEVRCVSVEGPSTLEVSWIPLGAGFREGFESYYLYRNDGSGWVQVATFNDPDISNFTDVNAPGADSRSYCYRLSTAKECPDFFVGPPGESVCSLIPTVNLSSQVNATISWQPYQGWDSPLYSLLVTDASGGMETIEEDSITGISAQYFNCNFTGKFRVKLVDPASGCEVFSAFTESVTLQDDAPTQPSLCRVTFDNFTQNLLIEWEMSLEDDFLSYSLFRKGDHETGFTKVFESNDINTVTFFDSDAESSAHSYCYYLETIDLCGGNAQSSEDCSILLKAESDKDYNIRTEWTPYQGWDGGVSSYEVWRDGTGEANLLRSLDGRSIDYLDDAVVDNQGKYCYQVRALEDGQGCGENSYSNLVCVVLPAKLFLPNAFTPNGDNRNDFFEVKGAFFQSFYIEIYNRWGKKLFSSDSQDNSWDGTFNGISVPEGVYVYNLRVETVEGGIIERAGSITLVR